MTQGEKKGHLSFSGLNTFEACQRNGYENYMQRVPESDARALLVGKLFHKCIEVGCDDDQIQEYIQNSKQKSSFFQKKK
ncbi:PD-(D/E)XK nuclease family protein, partial [Herbiconiux daphne]